MHLNELPRHIQQSKIFNTADLVLLLDRDSVPFIDPAFYDEHLKNIFQYYSMDPEEMEKELHRYAKELLDLGKTEHAWQVLLSAG